MGGARRARTTPGETSKWMRKGLTAWRFSTYCLDDPARYSEAIQA